MIKLLSEADTLQYNDEEIVFQKINKVVSGIKNLFFFSQIVEIKIYSILWMGEIK